MHTGSHEGLAFRIKELPSLQARSQLRTWAGEHFWLLKQVVRGGRGRIHHVWLLNYSEITATIESLTFRVWGQCSGPRGAGIAPDTASAALEYS